MSPRIDFAIRLKRFGVILENPRFFWEARSWPVFSLWNPTSGAAEVTQWVNANLIADLVDRHAARLELYASQWTAQADDCVQEALVALARQPKAPDHVVAWLYRVVRNRAINSARATRRRQFHEGITARLVEDRSTAELTAEDRISLPEALAALPAEDRELIVLRVWSDLTWQQIAELVDTSSSTAQRHYAAALEKLKKQLEPSCPPTTTCRMN